MKTVCAVILSALFLNGCVYTRPAPYYRANYTVVTPAPRYERHLYTPRPLPPPRFEYYQERPRFQAPSHRHHPRSRHYW